MTNKDEIKMYVIKADALDPPEFDWIWAVKLTRGLKAYGIKCGVKDDAGADEAEAFWDMACTVLRKEANRQELIS